jgi:A/G-specific adenine glycosylase
MIAPGWRGAPRQLIERLLAWYDRHRRTLPWRAPPGEPASAYHVLLSEVMLQQTTVATVSTRFAAFVARFPTLEALAAADEAEVLHAWQGLGYYRRARALHACAKVVVGQLGGVLPESEAALRALPGIGPYTASAIRAIALDQPAVPVDGNVERVLARLHGIETPLPAAAPLLRGLAAELTPERRAGDVAQALMDLGALVCRPRQPRCEACPWRSACVAHAEGTAQGLPRRRPKPERPLRRGLAFLLSRPDGAVLFRRRAATGLLAGLHELPGSPWRDGPLQVEEALRHAPIGAEWRMDATPVRHGFTHFVLEVTLARAVTATPPDGVWCRLDDIGRLALPTVMKKLLRAARQDQGRLPLP